MKHCLFLLCTLQFLTGCNPIVIQISVKPETIVYQNIDSEYKEGPTIEYSLFKRDAAVIEVKTTITDSVASAPDQSESQSQMQSYSTVYQDTSHLDSKLVLKKIPIIDVGDRDLDVIYANQYLNHLGPSETHTGHFELNQGSNWYGLLGGKETKIWMEDSSTYPTLLSFTAVRAMNSIVLNVLTEINSKLPKGYRATDCKWRDYRSIGKAVLEGNIRQIKMSLPEMQAKLTCDVTAI